ncbi:hypothetical protein [Enterobacter mori]|uniref:hypothetical protein n=1 Tax=Enterobacter mori TaxID=539813 RepID=UPI003B843BEA
MKWDRVALLVLNEELNDPIMADEAQYYIRRYNISDHLIVTINRPVEQFLHDRKGISVGSQLAAMNSVLAGKLTCQSKIIIMAHGALPPERTCSGLDAVLMARLLQLLGVTDVGLISFKSCYTGLDSYLGEFTVACKSNNIRFGWCLAYIDISTLTWIHPVTGKIRYLKRQVIGEREDADFLEYFASKGTRKAPDADRVRVVKGTPGLPGAAPRNTRQ